MVPASTTASIFSWREVIAACTEVANAAVVSGVVAVGSMEAVPTVRAPTAASSKMVFKLVQTEFDVVVPLSRLLSLDSEEVSLVSVESTRLLTEVRARLIALACDVV